LRARSRRCWHKKAPPLGRDGAFPHHEENLGRAIFPGEPSLAPSSFVRKKGAVDGMWRRPSPPVAVPVTPVTARRRMESNATGLERVPAGTQQEGPVDGKRRGLPPGRWLASPSAQDRGQRIAWRMVLRRPAEAGGMLPNSGSHRYQWARLMRCNEEAPVRGVGTGASPLTRACGSGPAPGLEGATPRQRHGAEKAPQRRPRLCRSTGALLFASTTRRSLGRHSQVSRP
jgi:hypothetical protein